MKKITSLALSLIATFAIAGGASAYTAKSGDTMGEIAHNHSMTLSELAELNPHIANLDLIYVGQNINTIAGAKSEIKSNVAKVESNNVKQSEKELMARLVRAEAESEPYAGKVAVATVVLNRVDHKDYPNSIEEVIYQSGQFTPVSNGTINKPYTNEDMKAVEESIAFRGQGQGSLFFYNPAIATSRWLDSKPTTIVIGNHVFKK